MELPTRPQLEQRASLWPIAALVALLLIAWLTAVALIVVELA